MNLKNELENARDNPAGLERLYRQSLATGDEPAFKNIISQYADEHPDDLLLSAWAYRLDIRTPPEAAKPEPRARHWQIAIPVSLILGVLYALFSGSAPPVPTPEVGRPLFWIGWAPLTALGIFVYLAAIDPARTRRYAGPAAVVILAAGYTALVAWGRQDNLAILYAIHLPLVAWAAVGAGLIPGRRNPAEQGHAFLVKSVETVLTGGIYFGAGGLFIGLTYGIFDVLGIKIPEHNLQTIAAWGIGAIPILALASVYDPAADPASQTASTGLARILNILTRLILPLALAVLAVYVFWFIPAYFWRPFREREVLIVYNATIMAILVLMTVIVPGQGAPPRRDVLLRRALLALGAFTLILNAYALAAILSRTLSSGLTPNRYAVTGWNTVTLLMLALILTRLWKAPADRWASVFRETLARASVLAVLWALWLLIGLPLSFD